MSNTVGVLAHGPGFAFGFEKVVPPTLPLYLDGDEGITVKHIVF